MLKVLNKLPLLLPILLSAVIAAPVAHAETELFDATYEGKYGALTIETDRRLVQLEDGTYRLESKASNFIGSISEVSEFAVEGEQWRPLQYTYKRRILGARTTETIEFDWDKGTAQYTHSKEPERNHEHKLQPGLLDPALYILRIQRDLALQKEPGNYRFIKRDGIRSYDIDRAPSETLQIGRDAFPTIQIRRAQTEDERQTYIWVIPELTFLIGKIVHLEDGDAHQMVLDNYQVDEPRLRAFFDVPTSAQTQKQ